MSNVPSIAHPTDRVMAFPRLSRANVHTNGDTAAIYHDSDLNAPAMAMPDGSTMPLMQPTPGAALADADATIALAAGAMRILEPGTLTAARTVTLSNAGALLGETFVVVRLDVENFAFDVSDGLADIFTFPALVKRAAYFRFDGVAWVFSNTVLVG